MIRWAQFQKHRHQIVLFAPTLDDSITQDHPVRLFDEVLAGLDFSTWEAEYERVDGQPPIHPRVMAGAILYGMSLGIRSSRKVEDATGNRVDFIWLCHGRVIDHATVAKFRVKFAGPIKQLFRQVGKVAISMGMANLNQIALDGTSKRSNNARYRTSRRASLEQKLAALDEQVGEMMRQWGEQDAKEQGLFGESSPTKLPRELKELGKRQARLRVGQSQIQAAIAPLRDAVCGDEHHVELPPVPAARGRQSDDRVDLDVQRVEPEQTDTADRPASRGAVRGVRRREGRSVPGRMWDRARSLEAELVWPKIR